MGPSLQRENKKVMRIFERADKGQTSCHTPLKYMTPDTCIVHQYNTLHVAYRYPYKYCIVQLIRLVGWQRKCPSHIFIFTFVLSKKRAYQKWGFSCLSFVAYSQGIPGKQGSSHDLGGNTFPKVFPWFNIPRGNILFLSKCSPGIFNMIQISKYDTSFFCSEITY